MKGYEIKRDIFELVSLVAVLFVFAFINTNYLLYHVVVELVSISILFVLFAITWNTRKYLENKYLLFLGLAAVFIGAIDMLHTITYKGMNIIVSDLFYANQLWIAARFFESMVLLVGFLFLSKRIKIKTNLLLMIYLVITCLIVLSIMQWHIFPVCYIEGVGQTQFKIISEYVIIAILFVSLFLLYRKRSFFTITVQYYISFSLIFTILSEFMFTLYFSNYDSFNILGHIFKGISYFLIYKANIENGLRKPTETLFRNLKLSEEKTKKVNEELEIQIATKNRFFSIISHDLKNPFNTLLGFTHLLLKNHDKYPSEKRKQFIQNLYDTAKKTFDLLQNLLTWSRVQNKKIEHEPQNINLSNLLNDNIQLVDDIAKSKSIEFIKKFEPLDVFADKNMVNTVVRNLLTNAIKFTHKNGKVTVSTEVAKNMAIVHIADTGVGISKDHIDRLFQIDKSFSSHGTENESGTGLGLILCADFVQMNKGKIWVESEIDKGSTFSFSLPLAKK